MSTETIVYIIDDDLDDQFFLIEAIKEIDSTIECYTATNGQDALIKLQTKAVPLPSKIFLDLNMPRIDGRKFLTTLKNHPEFNAIPVIIYTTSSYRKDRDEMKELGAANYLVKQADFALLRENLISIFSGVTM